MLQSVTILPGEDAGLYNIYLGDQKIENVTGVHVDLAVNEVPRVTLDVIASSVTIMLPEADVKESKFRALRLEGENSE